MVERNQPEPTDRLFPVDHKKQFNRILEQEGLKEDRQGNKRTMYSLRHSYISFRLLEQGGSGGTAHGIYEAGVTADWSNLGARQKLPRSVFASAGAQHLVSA